MKIKAITKFKHAEMVEALGTLGWSVSELARRCGSSSSTLGAFINLKNRPSKASVDKIEKVFIEAGIDLDIYATWPQSFKGFKKRPVIESTKDIPMERLISMTEDPLMLGGALTEHNDSINFMMNNLKELDEREATIIEDIYFKNKTIEECAQKIGRTKQRVYGIKEDALFKLSILQEDDNYARISCEYRNLPRDCYFLSFGRLHSRSLTGKSGYYGSKRFYKTTSTWCNNGSLSFSPGDKVTYVGDGIAEEITGGPNEIQKS